MVYEDVLGWASALGRQGRAEKIYLREVPLIAIVFVCRASDGYESFVQPLNTWPFRNHRVRGVGPSSVQSLRGVPATAFPSINVI